MMKFWSSHCIDRAHCSGINQLLDWQYPPSIGVDSSTMLRLHASMQQPYIGKAVKYVHSSNLNVTDISHPSRASSHQLTSTRGPCEQP